MKLKDVINLVDRSERNTSYASIEDFARMFDLHIYHDSRFDERVKKYWIYNWCCTDTWVGLAVYFMDDAPVAVSFQSARKSDENIEFVSKEAAAKVRDFIISLMEDEEKGVPIADMDQDIGDGYTVNYGSQLLTDTGTYAGETVKVMHRYGTYAEIDNWGKIDVQFKNGDIKTVELSEMSFAFNIAPEVTA